MLSRSLSDYQSLTLNHDALYLSLRPLYTQKTDYSIAICSKIFLCMVYFRCYLVNPHVQAVQNMCANGGRGCLRLSYGRTKLTLIKNK